MVEEKLRHEKHEWLDAEKEGLNKLNKFTKDFTELHTSQPENQRALEAIAKTLKSCQQQVEPGTNETACLSTQLNIIEEYAERKH